MNTLAHAGVENVEHVVVDAFRKHANDVRLAT
jgi:hypothetical protein